MKKLLYFLSIALAIFVAPSCNKKLDVLPQNSATADLIKSSSDVEALVFGGYEQLQDYGAFGEQFILVPDLFASDQQVGWVGTYPEYKNIQHKTIVSTDYIGARMWGNGYNVINIANTVLDKLSVVDSAKKSTLEGEARFMRAIVYFELTGLFAKPYSDGNAATNPGVPLVLLPTYAYDPAKNKPARATVKQVYDLVVSDLQTAIVKLPPTNSDYRADLYSAKAFLTRVYMSMGDYPNAATQANDIIQSGNFALTSSYDKAFNNNSNSSEDIFAIQQSTQSNAGTGNQGLVTFYSPQPLGRGDAQIDTGYYSYFEASDFRRSFVTAGTSISGFNGDYPNKWSQFYKAIPVVRLAEMYLSRGEANFTTGAQVGDNTPVQDINIVRNRSGASTLTAVSKQIFVDERFRELGFEGDRYWTLKRLQMNIDGLPYDDNKLILPIPQREIDANSNLVQNAGY